MMNSIPPQKHYDYHVDASFPTNANVHVHIHNSPNNMPANGKPKLIFDGTSFQPIKKQNKIVTYGKKFLGKARNLRMSHIMAIAMFGMVLYTRFGLASGTSNPAARQSQQQWIYRQGEQHIRDSIALAELQKQNIALQDSLKLLKKLPK